METDLLAFVMCVTLIAAWWFHLLLKWSSRHRRRRCELTLPPGSTGLPLLGESLEFFARIPSLQVLPFFKRRLERYGPVFKTNLVGKDMIVSLDPELNSYVLKQDNRAFQIWYPESLKRILGAVLEVTSSESLHKHMRTMVLRVFGPENLRLVLLRDVQVAARSNLSSWAHRPSIELKEAVSSMIFSVTAKLLINYDASTSSAGELWKHYDAFANGLMSFPVNIPGTAFYKCLKGRKNIMEALKHMLDERKEAAERRETMDFLDLVVDELKEKPVLDENFCLDVLFGLLFASIHTTSTALTAALKFLTDNPKALQELAEENEHISKGRIDASSEITWEEYKSMKFTSNVIYESLRLANIAPMLFRKANQDVHMKGYTIPEGWTVMICPLATHLNPITYTDPNIFNPWRWKDISEPVGGSKDFLVFGLGLRSCLGADFAKLQIATFLHCLVTNYRWEVVSGGGMVLSPVLSFPNGFHVKLIKKT
ncbi:Cytochrome P450 family protein, expressed [Panicum miliaceum]|uniref:Cytochrome P450 family protein, expressed n=1 Tax=Panicum miliaceum TaxID=4540 RepID=A0A3L6SYL5_PANMI|nr:Cytochrome P450 family protein, expressed [Panicum miliaceum]